MLSDDGEGVAARIEHVVDLGHYRRVTLSAPDAPNGLLAFAAKGEELPAEQARVRARRVLVYASGRLAGVAEPVSEAAAEILVRRLS
jgi:hypothetical protein